MASKHSALYLKKQLYSRMQTHPTPASISSKWRIPSQFLQIVEKDNRKDKTRVYSFYEQLGKDQRTLKYVLPLSEILLLNLMRLLELKIITVYQNSLSEGEKYYAEVLSVQQATTALEKLYHWDDFGKIKRRCEDVSDYRMLPEFVWVRQVQNVDTLRKNLEDYDINYSYLNSNFLIQKTKEKTLEVEVVIQGLRHKKAILQSDISILSNCLLIELHEDDTKLRQKYVFLETELNAESIHRCEDKLSRVCYVVELKNLLTLLQVRQILLQREIYSQPILWSHYLKLQESPQQQTFDLQAINHQIRRGDILDLQRQLNTPNSQPANQIDFILNNWDSQQPFIEDEMEELQNLLMSYQQDPQLVGFTRFTAIADFIKRVIPRCSILNQYKGKADQLAKELSLKQNNYIFIYFVKNAIKAAKREGEMIIQKQDVKQPLHKHIAQHKGFQTKSRKAVRWENLFLLLGNHYFQKERSFNQDEIACRNEYVGGIEDQMLLDLTCFGCCPFFYRGQNIRNSEVNTTPSLLIDSSELTQSLDKEIKAAMLELMNGEGGVILFDFQQRNRELLPRGARMSLDRQNEVSTKLKEYFEELVNKDMDMDIIKQMTISFVPVLKNPMKSHLKNGRRTLIDQTYVTRVKINRAFNKKHLTEQEQREMIFFGPKISCFHPGPCLETYQEAKIEKNEKGSDRSNKTTKPVPPPKKFKYLSLVIWEKKENRDLLNKRLRQQEDQEERGEVDISFEKYALKYTSNTAIVRHNKPFAKLKSLCAQIQKETQKNQPAIRMKGRCRNNRNEQDKEKMLIVSEVKEMITLPDRVGIRKKPLELRDFRDMIELSQLKEQFENEEIVFWRYRKDITRNEGYNDEYYFQVKDQEKRALLYFVLRSNSERARFNVPQQSDSLEVKRPQDLIKFIPGFVSGGKRTIQDVDELRKDLWELFNKKKLEKMQSGTNDGRATR